MHLTLPSFKGQLVDQYSKKRFVAVICLMTFFSVLTMLMAFTPFS